MQTPETLLKITEIIRILKRDPLLEIEKLISMEFDVDGVLVEYYESCYEDSYSFSYIPLRVWNDAPPYNIAKEQQLLESIDMFNREIGKRAYTIQQETTHMKLIESRREKCRNELLAVQAKIESASK